MITVFYAASIIAILATLKVVSGTSPFSSLLYLVISLLASAAILYSLGAYFAAVLQLILLTLPVIILFLATISFLKISELDFKILEKGALTPKIWLGPLILVFILFVMLIFSIVNSDYGTSSAEEAAHHSPFFISEVLLGPYILVIELAIFLILAALVVGYHFINLIWHTQDIETDELEVFFIAEKPIQKRKKEKKSL